jgi:hypothetical protein
MHHYAGSAARIKANPLHPRNIATTNKEPVQMAKKRAPGGGRKPAGDIHGKRAWFSTRITTETRAALEAEATACGKSVSQVAEALLIEAIATRREVSLSDPLEAFAYLVAQLEEVTCHGLDRDWRTDPFMFRAFKLAIGKFMDGIAPAGEVRSPIEGAPLLAKTTVFGPLDTPERRSSHVAKIVLHNFWRATEGPIRVTARYMAAMDTTVNAMARARAALLRDDASQALPSGKKLGSKSVRKSR